MHHLWKRSATKSTKFTPLQTAQLFRYNSRTRSIYTVNKEICRQPFGTLKFIIRTKRSSGIQSVPTTINTDTDTVTSISTISFTSTQIPPQRKSRLTALSHRTHNSWIYPHTKEEKTKYTRKKAVAAAAAAEKQRERKAKDKTPISHIIL